MQRNIDHSHRLRHDFGFAGESTEMMACVAVVGFNNMGMSLANDVPPLGQHLSEYLPAVCVKFALL